VQYYPENSSTFMIQWIKKPCLRSATFSHLCRPDVHELKQCCWVPAAHDTAIYQQDRQLSTNRNGHGNTSQLSTQCKDAGKRMPRCPFSWHIGYRQLCSASNGCKLHVDAEYRNQPDGGVLLFMGPVWNNMSSAMPNKSVPQSIIQRHCDYFTAIYYTALWKWNNWPSVRQTDTFADDGSELVLLQRHVFTHIHVQCTSTIQAHSKPLISVNLRPKLVHHFDSFSISHWWSQSKESLHQAMALQACLIRAN